MISSYSIGDMAIVNQYQYLDQAVALVVVGPIWKIIYSLGVMIGIGGSVILSIVKGKEDSKKGHESFSGSLIGTIILALISWLVIIFLEEPMLTLFGGEASLMPLSKQYLIPIKFVVPLFLFNQMLAAFLRNDNNPGLATIAVLAGGSLMFWRLFLWYGYDNYEKVWFIVCFLPFNIFSIYYFISNL